MLGQLVITMAWLERFVARQVLAALAHQAVLFVELVTCLDEAHYQASGALTRSVADSSSTV